MCLGPLHVVTAAPALVVRRPFSCERVLQPVNALFQELGQGYGGAIVAVGVLMFQCVPRLPAAVMDGCQWQVACVVGIAATSAAAATAAVTAAAAAAATATAAETSVATGS